jgi:hypothetical protein
LVSNRQAGWQLNRRLAVVRDPIMNIGRDAPGFQMNLNFSRLVLRIIYRWATKQESMARGMSKAQVITLASSRGRSFQQSRYGSFARRIAAWITSIRLLRPPATLEMYFDVQPY